ncbi:MAG: hypothetical protein M0P26_05355 [Bacteroidales bacterium]|nr:hypothetical protein [Bacteroidales bacterium]
MKRVFGGFILSVFFILSAYPQQKVWKVGVNSFFDNTEFGHSNYQMPQTMAGVHVAPEIGLSWDTIHHVFVGVDAMHEFGSNKTIDYLNPIAYYEYDNTPFRFIMGAFPRKMVLDDYPRILFSDSINNYRPTMTGLCWEFYHKDSYFRAWLDWTSRQTHVRHETFFMGGSARLTLRDFYVQNFSYMFHYAGVIDPVVDEALHDNGMFLTSLGVDLAKRTGFDKLDASLGWAVGVEDGRGENTGWLKHHALMFETKIEYRGLGLENSYYRGDGQMAFYRDHGMDLYWGDRIYRASEYDRADFYIRFFQSDVVQTKLMYTLHFAENQLYNEQSLYVSFNLSNLEKKMSKTYRYIWSPWIASLRRKE